MKNPAGIDRIPEPRATDGSGRIGDYGAGAPRRTPARDAMSPELRAWFDEHIRECGHVHEGFADYDRRDGNESDGTYATKEAER